MPEAPLPIQRWYPFRGAAVARPLGVLRRRRSSGARLVDERREVAAEALRDERARERPGLVERLVRTRQREARRRRRARRRFRGCDAGPAAPRSLRTRPVVAPATATVLFRSQLPRCRAETQSIAFFRTPGIEPLYSGVTKRSASASSMRRAELRDRSRESRRPPGRDPRRSGGCDRARRTARPRPRRERARRPPGRGPCCTTLPGGCRRWRGSSRQAALTAAKFALRTTSFGRRKPPPGAARSSSSPNSVRSTVPASSMPMRSLPHGSAPAPTKLPVSSTGLVTSLIVSVALDDELVAASLDRRSTRSGAPDTARCRRSPATAGARRGSRRTS